MAKTLKTKTSRPAIPGVASLIEIEQAKKASELKIKHKCKDVFLLQVEDKTAWLKAVDRKVISMASTIGGEDAVRVSELILDACWLEGDECIRDDDDYFLGAMKLIQGLMTIKTSSLKKL